MVVGLWGSSFKNAFHTLSYRFAAVILVILYSRGKGKELKDAEQGCIADTLTCNVYIEALEQQARLRHLDIHFTDLRPGFVRTDLLGDGKHYPMLMSAESVARDIVKAIRTRRHVCVIDWRYRVLTALWRTIPRWLWRRMAVRN